MVRLKASETRIPPDAFNRVVHDRERVGIERRGGDVVYLVCEEDFEILSRIDDRLDIEAADEALQDMKRRGQKPIPWTSLKKKLGL